MQTAAHTYFPYPLSEIKGKYWRTTRFSFLHSMYCPLKQYYGLYRNWKIL